MTNVELVARAHADYYGVRPDDLTRGVLNVCAAVVAALEAAGRLVPDGCVAVDADRWDRVQRFALVTFAYFRESDDADKKLNWIDALDSIEFGDLDEPVIR